MSRVQQYYWPNVNDPAVIFSPLNTYASAGNIVLSQTPFIMPQSWRRLTFTTNAGDLSALTITITGIATFLMPRGGNYAVTNFVQPSGATINILEDKGVFDSLIQETIQGPTFPGGSSTLCLYKKILSVTISGSTNGHGLTGYGSGVGIIGPVSFDTNRKNFQSIWQVNPIIHQTLTWTTYKSLNKIETPDGSGGLYSSPSIITGYQASTASSNTVASQQPFPEAICSSWVLIENGGGGVESCSFSVIQQGVEP